MPIRILPPILANQVAAGGDGVVRPASMVKAPALFKVNHQE
ncbi:hypothetical protein ACW5W4_13020 [Aeromonas crassostreae]